MEKPVVLGVDQDYKCHAQAVQQSTPVAGSIDTQAPADSANYRPFFLEPAAYFDALIVAITVS
jgi:hypothetical protein